MRFRSQFAQILLALCLLQGIAPLAAQDACAGLLPSRIESDQPMESADYAVSAEDIPIALREEPRWDAPVVRSVPAGEVLGFRWNSICADQTRWLRMVWDGDIGWAAENSNNHYWLEPYELPEPIVVSVVDGEQTVVTSDLLRFTVPVELADYVTLQARIGTNYSGSMRVIPNYTRYVLWQQDSAAAVEVGRIDVFPVEPWVRYGGSYYEGEIRRLRGVLDLQAPLPLTDTETGERLPVPDLPSGGSARFFGAAQRYIPFDGGMGFRFLSHYAQMTAEVPQVLTYRYQGIPEPGGWIISAEFEVAIPADVYPAYDHQAYIDGGDADGPINDYYRGYIAKLVARLDAMNPAATTPELSQIDAVFESLSITLPAEER
jgi:hypothetical protein